MKAFMAAVILCLFLAASAGHAFTMTDGGSYILEGVVTEGGGNLSGSNYMAISAVGQPAVGWLGGGPYIMCLGAFCTYMFEPGYSVRISGNLKYGDGNAVKNGEVWLAVEYMSTRFTGGKGSTDASGKFEARVNIPEFLYNKNFTIKIYASDDIDAVYECIYSQATGRCS